MNNNQISIDSLNSSPGFRTGTPGQGTPELGHPLPRPPCAPLLSSLPQSTLHSSSPASQLPHLIHHLVSTLPPKHLQLDSFFCPYCTCPRPGFHHLPSSCCKVSSSGPLSCPPSIHSLCRDQHCFPNASHPPPFFFTALSGLWDLGSLTRDEPQPLVMKSAES